MEGDSDNYAYLLHPRWAQLHPLLAGAFTRYKMWKVKRLIKDFERAIPQLELLGLIAPEHELWRAHGQEAR